MSIIKGQILVKKAKFEITNETFWMILLPTLAKIDSLPISSTVIRICLESRFIQLVQYPQSWAAANFSKIKQKITLAITIFPTTCHWRMNKISSFVSSKKLLFDPLKNKFSLIKSNYDLFFQEMITFEFSRQKWHLQHLKSLNSQKQSFNDWHNSKSEKKRKIKNTIFQLNFSNLFETF